MSCRCGPTTTPEQWRACTGEPNEGDGWSLVHRDFFLAAQTNGATPQREPGDDSDVIEPGAPPFAEPPPRRYRLWTPPDIWSPIEPPVYAVGTITAGDVAMMCAHGGSLKSWIALNAVLAKASGGKWLDRFECNPGGALYLDNEMGSDECRRRFQRNALAMGFVGPVDGVCLVSMPGFDLGTLEGAIELRQLAAGRALVVVDSLAAFSAGVDENDARFADPLKRMKEIGEATQCAFLLLHHSRKAREGEDQRERPRGTSALFAACDVVLQLERAADGFTLHQTKARKGKAAEDVLVRVRDVDGTEATRVWAADAAEDDATGGDTQADALSRAKGTILRTLAREHDIRSTNELCRRVTGRKSTVLAALEEHEERGLIVKHEGAYRLASEVRK